MSRSPADLRPESDSSSQGIRAVRIALVMVGVIAAFFLLREYWGHVAGNWIYLLLLACPLMHLFHGHGGHGRHGGHATPPQ